VSFYIGVTVKRIAASISTTVLPLGQRFRGSGFGVWLVVFQALGKLALLATVTAGHRLLVANW
jgi:hypothetical protein